MSILIERETSAGSAGARRATRDPAGRDAAGVEKGQTRPQALLGTEGLALASEEIPLASFEPGNYTLVIEVEDKASGEVLQRQARFKLERKCLFLVPVAVRVLQPVEILIGG